LKAKQALKEANIDLEKQVESHETKKCKALTTSSCKKLNVVNQAEKSVNQCQRREAEQANASKTEFPPGSQPRYSTTAERRQALHAAHITIHLNCQMIHIKS